MELISPPPLSPRLKLDSRLLGGPGVSGAPRAARGCFNPTQRLRGASANMVPRTGETQIRSQAQRYLGSGET